MSDRSSSHSPQESQLKWPDEHLSSLLLRLVDGGPEQQAIEAGEIDAVIDYSDSNVILFPAARDALASTAAEALVAERVTNNLLAALTHREYQQLAPSLEPVTLTTGDVLHEPGEPIR